MNKVLGQMCTPPASTPAVRTKVLNITALKQWNNGNDATHNPETWDEKKERGDPAKHLHLIIQLGNQFKSGFLDFLNMLFNASL